MCRWAPCQRMSGCPPKVANAELAWPLALELVCLRQSCTRLLVVVDVADPGLTPGGDAGAPVYVEETARLRRTGVRWHERAGLSLAPGSGCLQARAGKATMSVVPSSNAVAMTPRFGATVSSLVRRIARSPLVYSFDGRASGAASGQWSFRKAVQGAAGSPWRKHVEAHRNDLRQLRGGGRRRGRPASPVSPGGGRGTTRSRGRRGFRRQARPLAPSDPAPPGARGQGAGAGGRQ